MTSVTSFDLLTSREYKGQSATDCTGDRKHWFLHVFSKLFMTSNIVSYRYASMSNIHPNNGFRKNFKKYIYNNTCHC